MRYGLFDLHLDSWPTEASMAARDENVRAIVDVLEACTFPWSRVFAEISRPRQPGIPIPIRFDADLPQGTSGFVTRHGITLKPYTTVGRPSSREEPFAYLGQAPNFAHELAHVADVWGLDDDQHQELASLANHRDLDDRAHPHAWRTGPWSHRLIEAFTYPWAKAFVGEPWCYRTHTFKHSWPTDPTNLDRFRTIVLEGDRPMFTDVPDDATHARDINHLAEVGVIDGNTDGTFEPGEPVRRDQMAAMLARTLDRATPGWRPN